MAEPSLDQLMSDLRRIAREAPEGALDYEPPRRPAVQSLRLADHGVGIEGVAEPQRAASPPSSAPASSSSRSISLRAKLLGGALLLVLVGGAIVLVRKRGGGGGSAGGRAGPKAEAPPTTRARRGGREREEKGSDSEEEGWADEPGPEAAGAGQQRVRFAREVDVREFERDQPPQVSVKISSDDIL
jgi:hypothetical protein